MENDKSNLLYLTQTAVSRKAISIVASIAVYDKCYGQDIFYFLTKINRVSRHKVKRN